MSSYNEFTSCLITGKKDLIPLKGYEDNYLVKSKSSGFVFCSRIPSEEELVEYYSNYPIGYNTDSVLNRKRINERLDEFEKFKKENRILDVGCGPGLFLIEAKKRGWEVYGTEYTDKQIAYLHQNGIKTYQGKLNENSFKEDFFDVIISSEVIEHINNPIEELSNFYRFLRKGGLVYITTPNFNALERFFLKGKYNIIEYPEHLCYYTAKSIHLLMTKIGFKKLKITTTGISFSRIKNSMNKGDSSHEVNINNDEDLRIALESGYKKYIKNTVNGLLNFFKVGNSLKVWYIKD